MHRAAVNLEMNVIILYLNVGDVGGIARLDSWSPQVECLLQVLSVWRDHAFFYMKSFHAHGKGRTRIDQLGFKIANDFIARLLGHPLRAGRNRTRSRRILRLSGIAHLTVSHREG